MIIIYTCIWQIKECCFSFYPMSQVQKQSSALYLLAFLFYPMSQVQKQSSALYIYTLQEEGAALVKLCGE